MDRKSILNRFQFTSFFITFLLAILSIASLFSRPKDHPEYYPQQEQMLEKETYTVLYSSEHKHPRWVIEHLTAQSFSGPANRKKDHFQADLDIFEPSRSTDCDYENSGYSRGHNAPAMDFKNSQALMDETFLTSNLCPQSKKDNSGTWAKLEQHVAKMIEKSDGDAFVVTGPIYISTEAQGGGYTITYKEIGNRVSVPTHMFKVYLQRDKNGQPLKVECYIIPNLDNVVNNIAKYEVSIADIEKYSKLKFPIQYHTIKNSNSCELSIKKSKSSTDPEEPKAKGCKGCLVN